MTTETAATPIPAPRKDSDDLFSLILIILLFCWLESIAFFSIFPFWAYDLNQAQEIGVPWWIVPLGHFIAGLALLLPVLPLVWWKRGVRSRAIFQTWALGAMFFLLMVPVRFVPLTQIWVANLLQIGMSLLFVLLLKGWLRRRGTLDSTPRPATVQSVVAALFPVVLFALPWLAFSALGSLMDTVLNLAAGLTFGWAVSTILQKVLLPALNTTSASSGWNFILGGFVIGVLLNLMVAGYGIQGMPLLLMLCVPALGWVVLLYSRWGTNRPAGNGAAILTLAGVVAAIPPLLTDPDELTLILNVSGGDVLSWALRAAFASAVIGWFLAIIAAFIRDRVVRATASPMTFGLTGLTALVGIVLYTFVGQPGLHGDRIFVILKEQADVSGAASMEDYNARRTFVYETLTSHANTTQGPLRDTLDTFRIGYRPYYLVNAIEVDGGPLMRLWLSTRPEVDRILDSPVLRPLPENPVPISGGAPAPDAPRWNLTMIGAERVWEEFGVRGAGIVIGESDSGVEVDHTELQDSYRGRNGNHDYNWYDPWLNSPVPYDFGGHGTHTTGSIVGNTVGVAPDAEFIACVNLERNLANPALYLDCMQFMLAPFPIGGDPLTDGDATRGAHVLNNSWGCPDVEGCDPNALLPGVTALRAAGVFVVASAGNSGPLCETVTDPLAIYDAAFSVGAVSQSGDLTSFSSRGPVTVDGSNRIKPDIVAPGANVLSSYPHNTYEYADGTSMAGPHVVGVVALLWSANPDLIGDIDRTEQLLIDTADPASATDDCGTADSPSNTVGYGIVDAYEAVSEALQP